MRSRKGDTNKTREREQRRNARYKAAFDVVFGDPWRVIERSDYVLGERGDEAFIKAQGSMEGLYSLLSKRSTISAIDNSKDSPSGSPNASRPSPADFIIDVDRALDAAFENEFIGTENMFRITYMDGDIDSTLSIPKKGTERGRIELLVGRYLVARKIWPITTKKGTGYFDATRQRKRRDAV